MGGGGLCFLMHLNNTVVYNIFHCGYTLVYCENPTPPTFMVSSSNLFSNSDCLSDIHYLPRFNPSAYICVFSFLILLIHPKSLSPSAPIPMINCHSKNQYTKVLSVISPILDFLVYFSWVFFFPSFFYHIDCPCFACLF